MGMDGSPPGPARMARVAERLSRTGMSISIKWIRFLDDDIYRLLTVLSDANLAAQAFQHPSSNPRTYDIVFGNQYYQARTVGRGLVLRSALGNLSFGKALKGYGYGELGPLVGDACARAVPPMSSLKPLTMLRPSPEPPNCRVVLWRSGRMRRAAQGTLCARSSNFCCCEAGARSSEAFVSIASRSMVRRSPTYFSRAAIRALSGQDGISWLGGDLHRRDDSGTGHRSRPVHTAGRLPGSRTSAPFRFARPL